MHFTMSEDDPMASHLDITAAGRHPTVDFGNFKGQQKQDQWVYENIFEPLQSRGVQTGGYFIEFGARDGIFISNTYFFEKELGWQGVLVEAGQDMFDQLKEPGRRECKVQGTAGSACLYNAVASSDGEELHFAGMGKIGKDRHTTTSSDGPAVQTVKLDTIMKEFKLPHLDLLSADCEGCELVALQAFEGLQHVDVVLVEKNEDCKAISELMHKNGFLNILIHSSDAVFISRSVAEQIPKPGGILSPDAKCGEYTWDVWPGPDA